MRRGLLLLLLGGCTDPVTTGPATSSAHPSVRSALVSISNVALLDPYGTYRRWSVQLVDDPPGTGCTLAGEARVTIDLFTLFSSAPRGTITVISDPPPRVFPAAFVTVSDGFAAQGTVQITAAATTELQGSLEGLAHFDPNGELRTLDVVFEAPACTP